MTRNATWRRARHAGLTQQEIAETAGVAESTVRNDLNRNSADEVPVTITNSRGQQRPATYSRTEDDVVDAEIVEDDEPVYVNRETFAWAPALSDRWVRLVAALPTTESRTTIPPRVEGYDLAFLAQFEPRLPEQVSAPADPLFRAAPRAGHTPAASSVNRPLGPGDALERRARKGRTLSGIERLRVGPNGPGFHSRVGPSERLSEGITSLV